MEVGKNYSNSRVFNELNPHLAGRNDAYFSYDENGNMTNLLRHYNGGNPVNDLVYIYKNDGNQLENINPSLASKFYAKRSTSNYNYDDNGNMIHDQSKNTDIRYNNLNLPESVKFKSNTQNGHIYYHYDVMGNKIAQTKEEGNKDIIKTEYLGNFIYKNGVLVTILTEEGRIVPTGDTYSYEYNIKDHFGNTRATFAGTSFGADLIQTTSYYPFGLVMEQENFNAPTANHEKNQYLYNGKELQDEGFGGVSLGWLDYGARMYDPAIGRWHCIDPQAERYSSLSPYTYVDNNPINLTDPNGEEISFSYEWEKDKDGNYVVNENGGHNMVGMTMHVTGKVINVSGKDVDLDGAVAGISSYLESSFQGEVDGVSFKTEVNLTAANSMDNVSESDHVFALANLIEKDKEYYPGVSNDFGGRVAFLDADLFIGAWDKNIGNTGERTAAHEFGHLANLRHKQTILNLMRQNAGFKGIRMFNMNATYVSNDQLTEIHTSYYDEQLNIGSNSEKIKYPNKSGRLVEKKMPRKGAAEKIVTY